jgi:hypothetical protein
VVRIARIGMRGQRAPSGGRHQGRLGPFRGNAAGSGGDDLRVVRATRDQLGVVWSVEADPLFWQVVCWDSRNAAVARLKLSGTHRRATFAGLARLQQPFTIAVSGLGRDGSVLWQAGLADLYLRADRRAGRSAANQRRREQVSPKRPKKDPAPGKTGKTAKPKPKKKIARGK